MKNCESLEDDLKEALKRLKDEKDKVLSAEEFKKLLGLTFSFLIIFAQILP